MQDTKSIHENLLHFYTLTNNELSEREIKKIMSFTIASKRIKYLGMNLSKEVKDLYIENDKTLMKETEEDTNKLKRYSMLMDWENIVKMSILLEAIYRFNAISSKI